MPKSANDEEKIRLNLDLPKRTRERLERTRTLAEADSLTETIRRALAVYETLLLARQSGAKIVVVHPDGRDVELLLT